MISFTKIDGNDGEEIVIFLTKKSQKTLDKFGKLGYNE